MGFIEENKYFIYCYLDHKSFLNMFIIYPMRFAKKLFFGLFLALTQENINVICGDEFICGAMIYIIETNESNDLKPSWIQYFQKQHND